MKSILHLPFRISPEKDSVSFMVSHDLHILDTVCSVGSEQVDVYVKKGWTVNFKVERVIEDHKKEVREIFAQAESLMMNCPSRGLINVSAWSNSNYHVTKTLLSELFADGWTNPGSALAESNTQKTPQKNLDDGVPHPIHDLIHECRPF